jgi:hypothetical protein
MIGEGHDVGEARVTDRDLARGPAQRGCTGRGLLSVLLACVLTSPAWARSVEEDAEAFGSFPAAWGLELSLSGRSLSFLAMHASDVPFAVVLDLEKGTLSSPIASQPGSQDLRWCRWATEERLVCGFHGVAEQMNVRMALTRLVAVDRDGSDMRNLVRQSRQFLATVIDFLPDDPKRILVPFEDEDDVNPDLDWLGVAALDIRTTRTKWIKRPRNGISNWVSDGRGALRARIRQEPDAWVWEATAAGSTDWR